MKSKCKLSKELREIFSKKNYYNLSKSLASPELVISYLTKSIYIQIKDQITLSIISDYKILKELGSCQFYLRCAGLIVQVLRNSEILRKVYISSLKTPHMQINICLYAYIS